MPVRPIAIAESFDAALPLMQANWRETGDAFEFQPSREFYAHCEEKGLMFAMGAFIGNELVGYAVVAVTPHPFNPAVRMASCNPLYVAPQYRCGVLPGRLMLGAEREARERGAHKVYWHMRAGTKAADMLAEHGYECVDNVFAKEL
jgi:GNAT superfamily N-acetyltransferase